MSSASEFAEARLETSENRSAALHLIRETVETPGPPGILPSREAVLQLCAPEPVHEAEAHTTAIRALVRRA